MLWDHIICTLTYKQLVLHICHQTLLLFHLLISYLLRSHWTCTIGHLQMIWYMHSSALPLHLLSEWELNIAHKHNLLKPNTQATENHDLLLIRLFPPFLLFILMLQPSLFLLIPISISWLSFDFQLDQSNSLLFNFHLPQALKQNVHYCILLNTHQPHLLLSLQCLLHLLQAFHNPIFCVDH